MDVREVYRAINLPPSVIIQLIHEGHLRALCIYGEWYITEADLGKFLDDQRTRAEVSQKYRNLTHLGIDVNWGLN